MVVLPALTAASPTARGRRVAAALLAAAAFVAIGLARSGDHSASAPPALARRVDATAVALSLPVAWLATNVAGAQVDDRLDLVAVRRGDSASVYPLATSARILALEERTLVLAIDPDDAAQVALARASDLLIIPLLRSSR